VKCLGPAILGLAIVTGPLSGQSDTLIDAALRVQVEGFGGCSGDIVRRDTTNPHFPNVRFVQGMCLLEHGDTVFPLVAVDGAGVVYVLDSPSGFNFLARMHKAVGLDSSTALAYVADALVMSGVLGRSDKTVRDRRELTRNVLTRFGVAASEVPATRIRQSVRNGYLMAITTLGPFRLTTQDVLVYMSGRVRVITRKEWVARSSQR
jgi:hypothetical protein